MQEVRPGSPFTEFPGGTFNEIIRRIRRIEASLLPRRRGGGGGRSYRARGVAVGGISAFSSGSVTVEAGTPLSTTWWNESPRAIPAGYTCYADEYDGRMEIHSAFCPEVEEEET